MCMHHHRSYLLFVFFLFCSLQEYYYYDGISTLYFKSYRDCCIHTDNPPIRRHPTVPYVVANVLQNNKTDITVLD